MAGTVCEEIACGGRSDRDGPDTGVIVARFGDGKVQVFDSSGGGSGSELTLPAAHPSAMAVSPDGARLALGYDDGLVIVRDLKSPSQAEYRASFGPSAVHQLAFSSSGHLAVGHENGARLLSPGRPRRGIRNSSSDR